MKLVWHYPTLGPVVKYEADGDAFPVMSAYMPFLLFKINFNNLHELVDKKYLFNTSTRKDTTLLFLFLLNDSLYYTMGFFIMLWIRKILLNIKKDKVFNTRNFSFVKRIGSIIVGFSLLSPLLFMLRGYVYLNYFPDETYARPATSVDVDFLFFGLLAYFLAVILQKGNKLQQENELTI